MSQRKLGFVTIIFVAVSAVAVNEFVVKKINSSDRGVASSVNRFEPEQIKWEQELARTVSSKSDSEVTLSKKTNTTENFLFGSLQGKYNAEILNGELVRINVLQNQNAMALDVPSLVQSYAKLFKGATVAKLNSNGDFSLYNSQNKAIGNLKMVTDDQGRVLSLEVKN